MTLKGHPINITNVEIRDFFEDDDSQPLSNESSNAQLGAHPGMI